MKAITTILFCLLSVGVFAQSKEKDKYRQKSIEIKKEVWGWNKPQFNLRTVPAQYSTASKVILAHHTELSADSKVGFYTAEQSLAEIVRETVKLNDKNAVTEYSELSFTQFQRASGFANYSKVNTYIGLRIIKPDGSMKEINTEEIVFTKDEVNEKKAKLAVPDLQPGDILDYFIATEQNMTLDLLDRYYYIYLFDEAPILNLSFNAELGKKYSIEYRSYNGAPELQVNKNDNKEIIVSVEKNNIPPFETTLWVAPARQLPFIKMIISRGYNGPGAKRFNVNKPGEVIKATDGSMYMDQKVGVYSRIYDNMHRKSEFLMYRGIKIAAERHAKQMGVAFKTLSEEEKAALVYYSVRFKQGLDLRTWLLPQTFISNKSFDESGLDLHYSFEAADLNPAIVISDQKQGYRITEVMSPDDLVGIVYIPSLKKYFSSGSVFDIPFDVPVEIEGVSQTKSIALDDGKKTIPGPTLPVSASDKNNRTEKLKLALSPDRSILTVNRRTTLKGHYKSGEQNRLILFEDIYEAERTAFKYPKSLMEEYESDKDGRKMIEEVKATLAEGKKKQKEAFKAEAEGWFEQDITDMKDQKLENLGIRHTAPDFIYSSSFNLGGLVKKAGNNIIIEIGKIQGQPLVVKNEQRKRGIDVYMPFARSIEYHIELEIPEGYTAEGIAALNSKVENETGYFVTEASATDKSVSIIIKKHYLKDFQPAANWEKVLAFMDASSNWTNAKLLLKKKS